MLDIILMTIVQIFLLIVMLSLTTAIVVGTIYYIKQLYHEQTKKNRT
jgi:hypothetical protein